jgi:hypothetical protein
MARERTAARRFLSAFTGEYASRSSSRSGEKRLTADELLMVTLLLINKKTEDP